MLLVASQINILKAIKNNHFHTWPGLDTDLIQKHLDTNPHTVKGHLKQENKVCNQLVTKTS
jgi:hypothetical protein